ncbi:hypothetical protein M3223_01885 [Paenibacillus pasadenensis]|uniref:hypothetical protein n=1 Tax=Paenibacillus pasadenensis TaxID=217090 RepID=UPI00203DD7CA|nr:hypothetical protein [Paenibacillus pasadenensis]MCM3746099.1 hypothetical protein [Paenibacillus pasadenensis]
MNPIKPASISNVKGSSLGIILVLFILLVIVTRVFAPAYPYYANGNVGGSINGNGNGNGDGSSGVQGTKGFTLENRMALGYSLVFIEKFYNAYDPTPTYPIGVNSNARIEVSNTILGTSSGGAWYDIHLWGEKVAELGFTMVNRAGTALGKSEFSGITIDADPGYSFNYQTSTPSRNDQWLRITL